jgi:2-polyprenyl-3-methyl-5-hydroxy-6-metoxy-1,4-benzoquinol methylase
MEFPLKNAGYTYRTDQAIWARENYEGIAYSDGDEVEQHLLSLIGHASDLSVLSDELRQHCTDWPSLYYLSGARANLLRPLDTHLTGDILEIGAGCGAVTRFLGECGANVLALEGSPRRAQIARSRTRDLTNVTVMSEAFDRFDIEHKFDVVTLIGVLEYANLFTPGDNPHLTMLKRVRNLLKPNGVLILAIENQLGLKYFAGAPEDHLNISMYGIEGRYTKDQPQTFGRVALRSMIEMAGFEQSEFLAPFPDYKLPTTVLTEKGLNTPGFNPYPIVADALKNDPQTGKALEFSLEQTSKAIIDNHLLMDLSNSFLIVANTQKKEQNSIRELCWHFSTNRKKKFCKLSTFEANDSGQITVYARHPNSEPKRVHEKESIIAQQIDHKTNYINGTQLSQDFIALLARPNWRISQCVEYFQRYIAILEQIIEKTPFRSMGEGEHREVCGGLIDCTPFNIIIDTENKPQYIDKEWQLNEPIKFNVLLTRTIISMCRAIRTIGISQDTFLSRLNFIEKILNSLGVTNSIKTISETISLEEKIQSTVNVKTKTETQREWLMKPFIGIEVRGDNSITSSQHCINLNIEKRVLDAKTKEIESQLLATQNFVHGIMNSTSWKITKPIRVLGKLLKR